MAIGKPRIIDANTMISKREHMRDLYIGSQRFKTKNLVDNWDYIKGNLHKRRKKR